MTTAVYSQAESQPKVNVQPRVIVTASSDWIYHGISESGGEPALGINGELQLGESFFIGGEFHDSRERGRQQRHRSISSYAGLSKVWGEGWYSALTLKYRRFPGSFKQWNYAEWGAQLSHASGWSFNVDFASDYYHHRTRAVAAQLAYTRKLRSNWYWRGHIGGVELSEDRFADHHFASLGLGYSINALVVELAYHWNSEAGGNLFGGPVESPLAISLNYQWF